MAGPIPQNAAGKLFAPVFSDSQTSLSPPQSLKRALPSAEEESQNYRLHGRVERWLNGTTQPPKRLRRNGSPSSARESGLACPNPLGNDGCAGTQRKSEMRIHKPVDGSLVCNNCYDRYKSSTRAKKSAFTNRLKRITTAQPVDGGATFDTQPGETPAFAPNASPHGSDEASAVDAGPRVSGYETPTDKSGPLRQQSEELVQEVPPPPAAGFHGSWHTPKPLPQPEQYPESYEPSEYGSSTPAKAPHKQILTDVMHKIHKSLRKAAAEAVADDKGTELQDLKLNRFHPSHAALLDLYASVFGHPNFRMYLRQCHADGERLTPADTLTALLGSFLTKEVFDKDLPWQNPTADLSAGFYRSAIGFMSGLGDSVFRETATHLNSLVKGEEAMFMASKQGQELLAFHAERIADRCAEVLDGPLLRLRARRTTAGLTTTSRFDSWHVHFRHAVQEALRMRAHFMNADEEEHVVFCRWTHKRVEKFDGRTMKMQSGFGGNAEDSVVMVSILPAVLMEGEGTEKSKVGCKGYVHVCERREMDRALAA